MMSSQRVARLRVWQEADYTPGTDSSRVERVEYLGRSFDVPETVHPPKPVSFLLGQAVLEEVRESDRVLDMGTGSGCNAVLAASKSRDVLAVDINPDAVRCAAMNARLNRVEDKITVRLSDVFSEVDQRFDLVIFDPPFRWFTPRDMREAATTDSGYRAMTEFFEQLDGHLADQGRALFFFGSSGDLDYLHHLTDRCGFRREEIRSLASEKDGEPVTYYTYRLTRP